MLFSEIFLELLYPRRANCLGCGSALGADEGWFCEPCARLLRPLMRRPGERCPRCGSPGPWDKKCPDCGDWPDKSVRFSRYAYPYGRPVQGLIRSVKYGGVTLAADWMAGEMENLYIAERFERPDLITFVPMHPKRERARGFNQSRLLSEKLAERLGLPLAPLLTRRRDTKSQARLTGAQRRENLLGAFAAEEGARGKRILLVDDVVTTGATAVGCALALRGAGADRVDLIALAGPGGRGAP